jgi:DNA-binding transcriptional LysR family regulator
MLDIKNMQYLEAIYRLKNFTHASAELHVSQPAISAAISAMEKDLGFKLMTRTPQRVEFTTAGKNFMLYVQRMLEDYKKTLMAADDLSQVAQGSLRLGISPTVGLNMFSLIYNSYTKVYPNISVHIQEGPMVEHIEKVRNGAVEIAYNALPDDPSVYPEIEIKSMGKTSLYAIFNPGHHLSKYKALPLSLLEGENLVLLNEKSLIRKLILQKCEEDGVVPKVIATHDQILSMLHVVNLSNGIGFIDSSPNCSASGLVKGKFVLRPFDPPIIFDVGFIKKAHTKLSKAASLLVKMTEEYKNKFV